MKVEVLLDRLDGVRKTPTGWSARCPAHQDRSPSLSVRVGERGRILLHDFRGCDFREITAALGLGPRDLAPSGPAPAPGTWRPRPRGLSGEAREDILALWSLSDCIRRGHRFAREARRVACQLGESDRVWALLEGTTRHEVLVMAAEAELDEILRERIA